MKSRILIAATALVLLSAGVWYGVTTQRRAAAPTQTNTQKQPAPREAVVHQVDKSKLPERFPADIPLETGAKIEQNFNATQGDRLQATRQFVSQKSVKENYDLYTQWLEQHGWKIAATLDQPNLKAISATKGEDSIHVSINKNSLSAEVTADISYVSKK